MRDAPRGARIVVAGVCMELDTIRPMFGINKELSLQFVLGYTPDEFAGTLRALADGKIAADPLITGRVGHRRRRRSVRHAARPRGAREDPRDPGRRVTTAAPELLFYDGACGLCHHSVRFVLAHDRSGAFRFAPIGGPTFDAAVPASARPGFPDAIVVKRADGALLFRSDATLHILAQLGGGWRALAAALRAVPRPLRDVVYDWVARSRKRWFQTPEDACPVVPPDLRARFAP